MKKSKFLILLIILSAIALLTAGILILCGGEEEITYTLNDTLPDGEGMTARVILLGGQSNASGCSRDDYLQQNVSAEKYAEYKNGYDNVYINYCSGIKTSGGFVRCSTLQGEMDGCFGPELGLAERLHELYPDEAFFIIKWAWGGTNLYDQWLSPTSFGKTGELYRHFVSFTDASIEYLESRNYKVKIEAMCWMQGESDSLSVDNATDYERHLSNFIKDVRRHYADYSSDDGIAFVDAYIADNPAFWVYCDLVNESKSAVADSSDINVVIDTVSAGLTCSEEPADNPDLAHYDSLSQIMLGNMFADELAKFLDK